MGDRGTTHADLLCHPTTLLHGRLVRVVRLSLALPALSPVRTGRNRTKPKASKPSFYNPHRKAGEYKVRPQQEDPAT